MSDDQNVPPPSGRQVAWMIYDGDGLPASTVLLPEGETPELPEGYTAAQL